MPSTVDIQTRNAAQARDFLVFRLDDGQYGIELDHVQALCDYEHVEEQASAKDALAGEIELGNCRVPVHSPRSHLGCPNPKPEQPGEVIILRTGQTQVALAVDVVIDVVSLTPSEIRAATPGCAATSLVTAIGSEDERAILLLDAACLVDALLGQHARLAA